MDGHVLVLRVLGTELEGHHGHVQGEHGHPAGGVGLLEAEAAGQGTGTVIDRDVVEPEKAPLEQVLALRILAVDPPGEIEQQLVEDTLQIAEVPPAPLGPLGTEDLQGTHRVHRRVHVPEGPLVGGYLAVGVQVALAQHQLHLVLGEVDVDQGQGRAVIGQVPGGEPGILPLVGHADDVVGAQVAPVPVTPLEAAGRGRAAIALEPALDVVVEELLGPDHARAALAQDGQVLGAGLGQHVVVVDVGLGAARGKDGLASLEGGRLRLA